jgi:hypothetical protein
MEVGPGEEKHEEEVKDVSSSSSSSSSSVSSSYDGVWVHPRYLGKSFTSLIYETNLFVVTKNVNSVTNKRQVKCVSCIHRGSLSSANDWASGKDLDGTSTLIYHAQHEHSDDSLVSSILSQIQSQKNAVIQEKKQKMINCKMYGF